MLSLGSADEPQALSGYGKPLTESERCVELIYISGMATSSLSQTRAWSKLKRVGCG